MNLLLSLPDELIQHVAGYLPCSAVLSLSAVNRRLYQACRSRLLFQKVALDSLYNTNRDSSLYVRSTRHGRDVLEPGDFSWPQGNLLVQGMPMEKLAQLALAVEKCISVTCEDSEQWTMKRLGNPARFECSDWLPQLLALRHPATLCLDPQVFLEMHRWLSGASFANAQPKFTYMPPREQADIVGEARTVAEFINASFILSYTIIQRVETMPGLPDLCSYFRDSVYPMLVESARRRARPGTISMQEFVTKLADRVPNYSMFADDFTLAQAMAILPSIVVELVGEHEHTGLPVQLPAPSKIPFLSLMNLPPVMCNAIEAFSTCHVLKMATPDLFNGRRWTGLYLDQRHVQRRRFDPPMTDIRIIARRPSEGTEAWQSAVIIDEKSSGRDLHGDFTLSGDIRPDGLVRMVKQYTSAPWSWNWCAQLTPFGIVGTWSGEGEFGGYIWLWDQDWC